MFLTKTRGALLVCLWLLSAAMWGQQGEIQFTLNPDAVDINRVFVLPGTSSPCRGDELSSGLVAQYAEVKLLSHYNILERKYLDMVLKEQQLGMSGLVYESEAVEAGCLQGSEGIIFVEVGCLVSQSMVKLKLIDCKESAQQWNAMSIGADLRSLFSEVSLGIESGESRATTIELVPATREVESVQEQQDEVPVSQEVVSKGCADESACNYNLNADEPCRYLDAVGECGGVCSEDVDEDGVCDVIDDCVGAYDACGRCNGPGPVFECGCTSIEPGKCNCLGEEFDALGKCGGSCMLDADGDGVCDDLDECVGEPDECGVCNGPGAVYECGCSGVPPGDCDCDGRVVDALGVCGGGCWKDDNHDGVCDELEGCGEDDVVRHHGRAYSLQTFGGQCWFAESLRYVPRESAMRVWDVDRPHAYVVSDSTSSTGPTHVLYNFKAIEQWQLCPSGWRLPGDDDWKRLEATVGLAPDALNDRGLRTWSEPYSQDLWSNFKVENAGIRYGDGSLELAGEGGGFWSATEKGVNHAWYRLYQFEKDGLDRDYIYGRPTGLSVRCVRLERR